MTEKLDKLIKRHDKARQNYFEYQSVLKDAYTYALPDKGYFDTLSNGKRTKKIYDSTAILGVATYADKVQSNLIPPWRHWFMLVPGSDIDKEAHEMVQPQLDAISDIIYDHINHSNFNTVVNESLQDCAISTGVFTCESSDAVESSLTFESIPIEEVFFDCSKKGIIEDVFRTFKMPLRNVETSIRGAKIGEKLTKMLNHDENVIVEFCESVIKNEEGIFEHTIFNIECEDIIFESKNTTSPYIVFRERVTSKGVYGMGRVISLLHDIKILNKIQEMDLQNAGLAISGVYTAVDDGVLNPYNVKLVPGTVIPVQTNANNAPSLRALERAGDFNVAAIKIEQKQELIQKVLFGMPLGSVTKTPVRSATEVGLRADEAFEMSNAAFSRFQTEMLERLIVRIVDVLKQEGKIQPITVDGKSVTIKFTSPLAKQQDSQDINVLMQYAQTLAATGIPPQELAKHIKFEDIPRYIGENLGIDSRLLRTNEEKELYEAQAAQSMIAMQQMQQGEMQQ